MAYCSPSSSAVTIPTPGKSILKRPQQVHNSLFSRFTKLLPSSSNSNSANTTTNDHDDTKPLKRAHFILPEIAMVYPISSINPPSTPMLKDEKRAIEDKEYERRKRVLRGPPSSPGAEPEGWWAMDKVESFYRECCAGCEEVPDTAISTALKNAAHAIPRSVDLSGVQLTIVTASILSDVFTIEWGLRKVVFRECDLDEHTLKPILHSLLIPGTLNFLSIASNRRLKTPAFRLVGAYIKKAKSLRFLDLSQNSLDKKAIEYIVASLATAPEPGLESLRLDDCNLRPAAIEALCRAVRTSSLKHISLRHNRISSTGGVALALMIRDYPDAIPLQSGMGVGATPMSPSTSGTGTPVSSTTSSPTSSLSSLPSTPTTTSSHHTSFSQNNPSSYAQQGQGQGQVQAKSGPHLPPPRHPQIGVQTTYTPYIPRSKRRPGVVPTASLGNPLSPTGQQIPIITSSVQGGITTRHPTASRLQDGGGGTGTGGGGGGGKQHHETGPSPALLDRVRALDSLPRLGALRTLDLKGNDLRNGITYLAQVLKRNRTLKLLNLSENKLDVGCLVTIAEALKYNSCLETLDMSKNPCSGPSLDGIQSLRTAFTLNTSLKRLFLSSTSLTSQGAIALAEFLPESMSLLHLDLTNNDLDLAGVMALKEGLKKNWVMRCLDLNIPPGDDKYAMMCRDILNTCVRNTEEAERNAKASLTSSSTTTSTLIIPTSASSITSTSTSSIINPSGDAGDSLQISTPSIEKSNSISGLLPPGGIKRKGVWGLIEESELAKFIRLEEEKKMERDVVTRAKNCINQLNGIINNTLPTSTPSTPRISSSANSTPTLNSSTPTSSYFILSPTITQSQSQSQSKKTKNQIIEEVTMLAEQIVIELRSSIQDVTMGVGNNDNVEHRDGDDGVPRGGVKEGRLEELLGVHDELLELLKKLPAPHGSTSSGSGSGSGLSSGEGEGEGEGSNGEKRVNEGKKGGGGEKPKLSLKGLGLGLRFDHHHQAINGSNDDQIEHLSSSLLSHQNEGPSGFNVNVHDDDDNDQEGEEEGEVTPTTPRIDKGKGRAEPEIEEPEKVLSPSYVIEEDEDDEDVEVDEEMAEMRARLEEMAGFMPSPTERGADDDFSLPISGIGVDNRSKSWVEEEGEIFRKGQVLLGPEELEGEYAGEELRKELLEAMVERPPPRVVQDEYGSLGVDDLTLQALTAHTLPSPHPHPDHNHGNEQEHEQQQQQQTKPSPRPYISRKTSSASVTNSIMGVISPKMGSPAPSLIENTNVGGNGNGNGGGDSPHALANVPIFVKRNTGSMS